MYTELVFNYMKAQIQAIYPFGGGILRVSKKNTFCAWTLAVTVSLILVEVALALWIYLIEFTTFILVLFYI